MRTNIVIDDRLMARAARVSGCRTKRATVETALKKLVEINEQARLRDFKGSVDWQGDLEAMRKDR